MVRDVDVAHEDELAFLPQAHQVRKDLRQEAELGLLALLAAAAAGEVAADDRQLALGGVVARFHPAALGVEFVAAKPVTTALGACFRNRPTPE